MWPMVARTGSLLVLFLVASLGRADEAKDEVMKASEAYDAAIKAGDVKALEKILDADGHFIREDGRLLDKRGAIAEIGKEEYESVTMEEHTIRVFGETAVETGRWSATGKEVGGKPFHRRIRFTTVWVKKGGAWAVMVDQATNVEEKK